MKLLANVISMIIGGLLTGVFINIWDHDANKIGGFCVGLAVALLVRLIIHDEAGE